MQYPIRKPPFVFVLSAIGAFGLLACTKAGQAPAANDPSTSGDSPSSAAGAEGTHTAQRTGPIAPSCSEWSCAEVEMSVALSCNDPRGDERAQRFGSATRISGRTTEVGCGVTERDGGLDLNLMVRPTNAAEGDHSEVNFTLRSYTGPGTYRLFNREDENDFAGLEVVGNVDAPPGSRNAEIQAGTVACRQPACEAIVAEGSEPIPTDEYAVHPFRVRVEVRCPAGSEISDFGCEDDGTICAFASTPTILADFLCGN